MGACSGWMRAHVHVAADASSEASVWIDWLTTQICGFCAPSELRPHSCRRPDGDIGGSVSDGGGGDSGGGGSGGRRNDGGALVDEATATDARSWCILASAPTITAAGLELAPGAEHSFYVLCEQLPEALPPSFEGAGVCCEYMLFVSVRAMTCT